MATIAKTVVATGASSGLGFEVIKQLLSQGQPYNLILGVRNIEATRKALDGLQYDSSKHKLTVLPLELSDLKGVGVFAKEMLGKLGQDRIDFLMLNAALTAGATSKEGPHGSKWCTQYLVNHLSQHYLVHCLRDKLAASGARIVVVSSGAVRQVQDTAVLDSHVKAGSGETGFALYGDTKFIQLLNAHWWRRQLAGRATVVAVSPGLIPNTGISRGFTADGITLPPLGEMKDAKSVSEGAESILRAFTAQDLPADSEQIFLTSWGEWWDKSVYGLSLDQTLQDKWSPSKEDIEREERLA